MSFNENLETLKIFLPKELNKDSDADFNQFLGMVINHYSLTLATPTYSLFYAFCKLSCIDYLLSRAASLYDTKEMDIQEFEGQIYPHYKDMYDRAEKRLEGELAAISGGAFSIGVITKQTPVPYANVLYFNPNSSFFRGRPVFNYLISGELP